MREVERREDARRRLPVLLELPWLRRAAEAQARGLLCVLQLRQCSMSAGPGATERQPKRERRDQQPLSERGQPELDVAQGHARGISLEYSQLRRATVFIHSLKPV